MQRTNHVPKLSRSKSHRVAMFRNMAVSIIDREQIITTTPKAKALRSYLERLITLGKRAKDKDVAGQEHVRRLLFSRLRQKQAVQKIMRSLVKRYQDRQGGYIRLIATVNRKSDNSRMSLVEFVDRDSSDPLKNYGRSVSVASTESDDKSSKSDGKKFFDKSSPFKSLKKSSPTQKVIKKKAKSKVIAKKSTRKETKKKREETPEELQTKERKRLLVTPTKKKRSSKKKVVKTSSKSKKKIQKKRTTKNKKS